MCISAFFLLQRAQFAIYLWMSPFIPFPVVLPFDELIGPVDALVVHFIMLFDEYCEYHDLGITSTRKFLGGIHGMFVKGTTDVGESLSFMVRCFAIEQPFGDMYIKQICFLHL